MSDEKRQERGVPDRANEPGRGSSEQALDTDRVSPIPALAPVVSARETLLAFGLALAGRDAESQLPPREIARRLPRRRPDSGVIFRSEPPDPAQPATAPPGPCCDWGPSHGGGKHRRYRWPA